MSTILITGSNRGIGLSFCRAYSELGWEVVATCRNPDSATDLKQLSGKITILPLDVTSGKSIAALAASVKGKSIDILVNNAAIHGPRDASGTFGEIDLDVWIEVMKVNTMAPIKVTEALLPNVVQSAQKKLVFISSMAGSISLRGSQSHHRTGGPYIYRTSKAALNAAVKAIGFDLRAEGVSVVALHPGWVKTETGGWDAPGSPEESVEAMVKLIESSTPEANGIFLNVDGSVIGW
jgi:NAD(P)-dependent dehydrogenase (short-subunit alcohol dehydrogenase family)